MTEGRDASARRAVAETTAFDGLLDVYRFEDGTIAVSSRGAARGLTGGAAGKKEIEPYARGMLAESGAAKLPVFDFVTPRGALAKGLLLEDYIRIVEWYANGFLGGKLHANQSHIGLQCLVMQSAAARLGWEVLSKSWFGESLPAHQIPILYSQYVRDNAEKWSRFYQWELPEALAPLIPGQRGKPMCRKQWPVWMPTIHSFLYRTFLGSDLLAAARSRKTELDVETLHQVLSDNVQRAIKSHLPTMIGLARSAKSLAQWRSMVRNVLGVKTPTQLDLLDEEMFDDVPGNDDAKGAA